MKKQHKRSVGKTILAVVLIILLLAGAGYFVYVYFQVENVDVKGNASYDASYIVKLADVPPKTHMFMVDTEKIKENIETEPYLQVDGIAKSYPKTLVITVTERVPKALILYADKYLLVDGSANVLEILDAPPEQQQYPVVSGITINSVNLGKAIDTEDTFKISVLADILAEMENKDLYATISTIDLSDVNNIRMQSYDGMMIKFGQSDKIADKMKWIKKMLPKLAADGNTSGVYDVTSGTSGTYRMTDDAAAQQAPTEPGQQDDPGTAEPGEGGEPAEPDEPLAQE